MTEQNKETGFAITGGKGFHLTLDNGWTVSVQFGPYNYGSNYNMGFKPDEYGNLTATAAEIAALTKISDLPAAATAISDRTSFPSGVVCDGEET